MMWNECQRQLIEIQHVIKPGYADYQQHWFIIWIDYYDKMHSRYSKDAPEITAWTVKAG